MEKIHVLITGATGMVGEGVLMHCLDNDQVASVLMVNRRPSGLAHPKLKELILPDFNHPEVLLPQLQGYDACFFCAGVSSVGMKEAEYTHITYDTTLHFAKALAEACPDMVFNYVSGAHTDKEGRQMWQRVKGRTEAALMTLGFRGQYNFRPGFMKPLPGQQRVKWFFKPVIAIFPRLFPRQSLKLQEVAQAMIHTVALKPGRAILEIKDIRQLAAQSKLSGR